jgi:bifunctional ADP-heptose synthase (sugar kinase/adenylyltransferase)
VKLPIPQTIWLPDHFERNVNNHNIILILDYNKGLYTPQLTEEIIRIANVNGKKVLG